MTSRTVTYLILDEVSISWTIWDGMLPRSVLFKINFSFSLCGNGGREMTTWRAMERETAGSWLRLVCFDAPNRWYCDIISKWSRARSSSGDLHISQSIHASEEKMLNRKCLVDKRRTELLSALCVFALVRENEEVFRFCNVT